MLRKASASGTCTPKSTALDRIELVRQLRIGDFDILVGINLLREGLDIPEVATIFILDADKEGFLRDERSLIQTIGRAARNVNGRVILYADVETRSIKRAMEITSYRRTIPETLQPSPQHYASRR